ncbi:MAG: diadenylate cyclase CdaA [Thermoanaerobaculia bacterium]|nr:diadenylate cyclase CdaA [Thermoanaerobaculia bacterium]
MDFSLDSLIRLLQPLSSWTDWLDVLLVALVLYYLLLLIRGTRAVQVMVGILALVVIYYGARTLDLPALEMTLETFFALLPVAIIVLFQHEIRRALAGFGRTRLWGTAGSVDIREIAQQVTMAAATLAESRIGALIVFERREGLRNYIENGIQIDAEISIDLLVSLFFPDTPTHDGAVIIQNGRIAAATCFLPLTRSSELSTEFGTRHRAAVGISEETDAIVVVVSEETGDISLAVAGQFERPLSSSTLLTLLVQHLTEGSA